MTRRFVDMRTIQRRMQFKDDRINRALARDAARRKEPAMSVEIPAYLQSHLDVADSLPQRLDDVAVEEVEMLQQRLRHLVELVANRDATIFKLTRALGQAEEKAINSSLRHAAKLLALFVTDELVDTVRADWGNTNAAVLRDWRDDVLRLLKDHDDALPSAAAVLGILNTDTTEPR